MKAPAKRNATTPDAPGASDIFRVVVVDDSRLQRTILTKMLVNWGYQTVEFETAEAALSHLSEHPVDLVISDWMMPGMSGPDLCRKLRKLDAEGYRYFILLTSKNAKEDVAEGLDAGSDDFLTKPVNAQELRARLAAGRRVVSMERELQEKNRLIAETLGKLQTLYDAIDADLLQARRIQEALIPQRHAKFGPARISLLMKPCGHVGGDLVGMFDAGQSRVGFFSIDVSGHGITSAMMTARVAGYLNSRFPEQNIALERRFDRFNRLRLPEEVATILNARLDADPGVSEYLTMVFATFDTSTGRLKMVQAGHPRPLLWRASGALEFLGGSGLPVGLIADAEYEGFETILRPGDRLLLYSDGFTECDMANGTMLDEEGLIGLVQGLDPAATGTELLDDLYWRLSQGMPEGAEMADDVSATLLEFHVQTSSQIS